jgi:hypothetical protein
MGLSKLAEALGIMAASSLALCRPGFALMCPCNALDELYLRHGPYAAISKPVQCSFSI